MLFYTARKIIKGLVVLLALFCVLSVSSCSQDSQVALSEFFGMSMGTSYNIRIVEAEKKVIQREMDSLIRRELASFNRSLSTYIDSSELSLLNKSPVERWVEVSQLLCDVLTLAESISQKSEGLFDVTVGPLVNVWGFGPNKKQHIPAASAVAHAKSKVGYQSLQLDCEKLKVKKHKDVYIDLSAIAKGYAADMLAGRFLALGYRHFMIEIGGELRVSGLNADKVAWRIAVEKPAVGERAAVQVLNVSNVGLATSGDYRNYYEVDGRRVSHTIDPVKGAPIEHKLVSVTVVADTSGEADAWATALNVIGPDGARALAEQYRLAAFFITANEDGFDINYTDAFKQYLVKK